MIKCAEKRLPANEKFKGIQFGAKIPSGVDKAVLSVKVNLLKNPDSIAVFLDAENAYSSAWRSFFFEEIYKRSAARALWPALDFIAGKPTPVLMMDRGQVLDSTTVADGWLQGNTLASVAFAEATFPALEKANSVVDASVTAYVDDNAITGPARAALDSAQILTQELAARNIKVNMRKSFVLWPHDSEIPERVSSMVEAAGFSFAKPEEISFLGCPISLDDKLTARALVSYVEKGLSSLSKIRDLPIPAQDKLLLVRKYVVPKFNFVLRQASPSVTFDACKIIQDAYTDFLSHLLDAKPTPSALRQAGLRVKDGGCGLTNPILAAPAAFLGAQAAILQDVVGVSPSASIKSMVLKGISDAYGCLRPMITDWSSLPIPASPDEFFHLATSGALPPRGLQKSLMDAVFAHCLSPLISTHADTVTAARVRSCGGSFASGFINSFPKTDDLTMPNHHFRAALCDRLGLSPYDDLPSICGTCRKPLGDAGSSHFCSCPGIVRGIRTTVHDSIVGKLKTFAGIAGVPAQTEPPVGHGEDRADLLLQFTTGDVYVDVSIITPTAKSYVRAAAKKTGAAAVQREKRKIAKYKDHVHRVGGSFMPFVIESFGTFGKAAQKLLTRLQFLACSRYVGCPQVSLTDMVAALAMIVARGNASAIDQGWGRWRVRN